MSFIRSRTFEFIKWRKKLAEVTVNNYYPERVMRFGPDLACLEWLMKCGSTQIIMSDETKITSQKEMQNYFKNLGIDIKKKIETPEAEIVKEFNSQKSLDRSLRSNFEYNHRWKHIPDVHIKKIDATDSVIANTGFVYFRECRNIITMKLNCCDYFGDIALRELTLGRTVNTLKDLEIVMNSQITDSAVNWLSKLSGLKRLHLYFNPWVTKREVMLRALRVALHNCEVTYPKTNEVSFGYINPKEKDVRRI